MEMGRPRSVNLDLPPRIKPRKMKSGKVNFYYTGYGGSIPLGDDYGEALRKWTEHEIVRKKGDVGAPAAGDTFDAISREWEEKAIHIGRKKKPRSPKTQKEYRLAMPELRKAFGQAKLEQITPQHIRQYLDRRSAKVSANREIAAFSVIWNWARGAGKTALANPCTGIDKNYETPRERYVHDNEYAPVWDKSVFWLQDVMDMLKLSYQRPSDILKCRRHAPDISDGHVWFKQGKTGKRLGFAIEGEFKQVIERILARPRKVATVYLIADENGQPISIWRLDHEFAKARGEADWQLRDLRAKAVTDTLNIKEASERAGHADEKITRRVYERTRGMKVRPLR